MKQCFPMIAAASLTLCALAAAETSDVQSSSQPAPAAEPAQVSRPQLSDNPKMQAEGKRLAALMEKLQTESDPDARRKIMSEAMCPQ
jgi:hypothetical protein